MNNDSTSKSWLTTWHNFIIKYEFLMPAILISICCVFIFHDFIFCKKLYLFKDIGSDSLNYFYPKSVHLSRYLREYGLPGWSFNIGLGQDSFPFSIGNPFELFLAIFPPQKVGYAIIYAECSKIILSGMLIFKAFRISRYSIHASLFGCILYSFSAYMVLGGQWHIFSTEAFHVAFLIFGYEKFRSGQGIGWLIGAFFLIASLLPFNLYLTCIFLLLYSFFRSWSDGEPVSSAFKRLPGLTCALSAGIGLSSVFFLPALYQMLQSSRTYGLNNILTGKIFRLESPEYYITLFSRMLSNDLAGTGNIFSGWGNYMEAPLIYMGISIILFAPLSFIGSNRRYQTGMGTLLLITGIFLFFPFFRNAFWIGIAPFVRFLALMSSTFMLIAAIKALDNADTWNRRHFVMLALISVIVTLFLFTSSHWSTQVHLNTHSRTLVLIFIGIYTSIIAGLIIFCNQQYIRYLLIVAICVEVIMLSHTAVNKRPVLTKAEQEQKSGYNDYTSDAILQIKSSDHEFHRVVKEYSSTPAYFSNSLNDGMMQDYYGVTSYLSSFNHPSYISFLATLGIIWAPDEAQVRWLNGALKYPQLLNLLNTRYILTKNSSSIFLKHNYTPFGKTGDVLILKNQSSLPFGYSYQQYISPDDFRNLSTDEKLKTLSTACLINADIGDKEGLKRYQPDAAANHDLNELAQYSLKISSFLPNRIVGEITVDHPRLILFSMPYDKGWSAEIDGKRLQMILVNGGLSGVTVQPGKHRIMLLYRTPWLIAGMISTLLTAVILLLFRYRRKWSKLALTL